MKKRMIITLSILGGALVALIGIIWFGITNVLPYSAIKPFRVTQQKLDSQFPQYSSRAIQEVAPTNFTFTTRDSVQLDSWLVRPQDTTQEPKGTVIVFHGIASCKEMMLGAVKHYSSLGYNVLAYDSRANGKSGGDYCTLGYYEKYDVSDCITFAEQKFGITGPYAVHGSSMGGAIAMQALAVEPRLQCGVIMSTFATLHETMYDYMEQIFGIRWQWIGEPVMKKSERIARFSIDDVAPEQYARNVHCPVLLVHGDSDEKIYLKYGERLYNALGSQDKQLKVIKGAKHLDVDTVGADSLQTTIAEWMNTHLNQSR